MERVALHRADHGQRRARAAAGELDDAHARPKRAARFGAFDHRQRHAILVRPGRVEVLQLDDDRAEPGGTIRPRRTSGVRPIAWRTESTRAGDVMRGTPRATTAIYQTARKRLASIDSDAVQRETVRGVRAVAGESLPVLVPAQTKLHTEQCLGRWTRSSRLHERLLCRRRRLGNLQLRHRLGQEQPPRREPEPLGPTRRSRHARAVGRDARCSRTSGGTVFETSTNASRARIDSTTRDRAQTRRQL